MRPRTRPLLPLAAVLVITACVPPPKPAPPPAPAPTPIVVPSPAPATSPQSVYSDWRDAPQTPGDWIYSDGVAKFGTSGTQPVFWLACSSATKAVEIGMAGATAGSLRFRTETRDGGVDLVPTANQPPTVVARLNAQDPLLDAIAFSSGRFAVESAGQPTLYVPSWPEVMRVIDDCR